ncbi:CPBP family intramembrane metalloprotease [Sulfurimonas sp. HSL-3221]|uniref:CPBP family intramembrane glutamic endopeptidase n=1 Tax=Sulfurimonadaceae TaxID=2771471 RepID=UPI001E584EDF|nr:CPBP family intramembrane glutamic endopeptidase [Sulfurimonas sp. HSL-3221]UFS63179.1 CPBP family intramembrane metalloprotease [Sulfurimonas sp. HSL-3221]
MPPFTDTVISSRLRLLFETVLLYFALPMLIITGLLPKFAVMPLLWLGMLYALYGLRKEGNTHLRWHIDGNELLRVLVRFIILGTLLDVAIWALFPGLLFAFPRERPGLWLLVMLLYPLLSALAQEIVFRGFFTYRFEHLIADRRLLILFNALLFSLVHGVFGNPVAVILSFLGGVLFMRTYLRTRSVAMSAIEHSLYGNLVFTLGIGGFFYHAG